VNGWQLVINAHYFSVSGVGLNVLDFLGIVAPRSTKILGLVKGWYLNRFLCRFYQNSICRRNW